MVSVKGQKRTPKPKIARTVPKNILNDSRGLPNKQVTRPQLGPFFVLKFVRSRVLGANFLQPFPKSLVTVKCHLNTKIAVNSR